MKLIVTVRKQLLNMETLLINYFPAYFKFDFVIYLEGRNTNRFLIYPEKVTKTTKKIREMSIAAFAHLESATHCKRSGPTYPPALWAKGITN